jgi:hypothetical protein
MSANSNLGTASAIRSASLPGLNAEFTFRGWFLVNDWTTTRENALVAVDFGAGNQGYIVGRRDAGGTMSLRFGTGGSMVFTGSMVATSVTEWIYCSIARLSTGQIHFRVIRASAPTIISHQGISNISTGLQPAALSAVRVFRAQSGTSNRQAVDVDGGYIALDSTYLSDAALIAAAFAGTPGDLGAWPAATGAALFDDVSATNVDFTITGTQPPVTTGAGPYEDMFCALTSASVLAGALRPRAGLRAGLTGGAVLEGQLRPRAGLVAALASTSDLAAPLRLGTTLRAALTASGTLDAPLRARASLAAALTASGALQAPLRVVSSLAAPMTAGATLAANLGMVAGLSCAMVAGVVVGAVLRVTTSLASAMTASATLVGELDAGAAPTVPHVMPADSQVVDFDVPDGWVEFTVSDNFVDFYA